MLPAWDAYHLIFYTPAYHLPTYHHRAVPDYLTTTAFLLLLEGLLPFPYRDLVDCPHFPITTCLPPTLDPLHFLLPFTVCTHSATGIYSYMFYHHAPIPVPLHLF